MVEQTVGKLLEHKTPRQAARLKILDPACGSGSFLINAYQYLLDWYRDYNVNDGPRKHPKELYQ
jgi:type I restriction-modification system DNA methylase subunit